MRNKERLSEERWSVQCAVRGGRGARGASTYKYTLPNATAEVAMSRKKACPFSAGAATVNGLVPSSACTAHAHATRTSRLHVYVYEIRDEQHDCRNRRAECSQRTSYFKSADETAGTRAGRERLRLETRVATHECSPLQLIRARCSTATLLYFTLLVT